MTTTVAESVPDSSPSTLEDPQKKRERLYVPPHPPDSPPLTPKRRKAL